MRRATGHLDPDLTKVDRDAPTVSAVAEQFQGWHVGSLDVRTALLAGDHLDRNLCVEVPVDLWKEVRLASNEILKTAKACERLGQCAQRMVQTPPCTGILSLDAGQLSPLPTKTGRYGVHGVLEVHVDDLIGGGDDTFSEVLARLCNIASLAQRKRGRFACRGRRDRSKRT